MSNYEVPWPGPDWAFTVHKGFPPMNTPGDLYQNFSGGYYLNTGRKFVQLSKEEWHELLYSGLSDKESRAAAAMTGNEAYDAG